MNPQARKVGSVGGRAVYRFPVRIIRANSYALLQSVETVSVLAHSGRDAAALVYRDLETRPETEIVAFGVKGGIAARRYIGWESAIGNQLAHDAAKRRAAANQSTLAI